jgi:hypothetical protein
VAEPIADVTHERAAGRTAEPVAEAGPAGPDVETSTEPVSTGPTPQPAAEPDPGRAAEAAPASGAPSAEAAAAEEASPGEAAAIRSD